MRGVVPAGMLLVLWAAAISACFYGIIVHPVLSRRKEGGRTDSLFPESAPTVPAATTATTAEVVSFRHHVVPVAAAFVFNACVTAAVNTAYIYSTQQALSASTHFCIQWSLSIFRLLFVAVVFPLLSRPIRSVIENVRFRFVLLTINNLLLPCVVTALTSDACFQVLYCSNCTGVVKNHNFCTQVLFMCCMLPINCPQANVIMYVLTGIAHSSRRHQDPLLVSHVWYIHYPARGRDILFSIYHH